MTNDNLEIYEVLLEQQKAIRNLKVELESLKKMMFEHRPQFVPIFEENTKLIAGTSGVRNVDTMIARLEQALKG